MATQEAGWYGAIPLAHPQEDELAALVHEHARLVYRVAFSVLRHHHDAEDAVQETFMRVMRLGANLREVRTPKTWLARIAWRVAIDRKKKTHEVAIDELAKEGIDLVVPSNSADEIMAEAATRKFLQRLIAGLPEKLRDPLLLSTLEEMSTAEIGEVLGMSEAAVRSRQFRAREILREKLAAVMGVNRGQ